MPETAPLVSKGTDPVIPSGKLGPGATKPSRLDLDQEDARLVRLQQYDRDSDTWVPVEFTRALNTSTLGAEVAPILNAILHELEEMRKMFEVTLT